MFPRKDFSQKGKKNKGGGGGSLRFGENMPRTYPKSEKNLASSANKAIASVSPKILQLDL